MHSLYVAQGTYHRPMLDTDPAQGSAQVDAIPTNWRAIRSARFGRRRSVRYPRAGAKRSAHRQICRRRLLRAERSAQTKPPSGSLPDRAWRFGPTAALSGRGDNTLPVPITSQSNRHPQSGSRMRRHRWVQASELPTRVASTQTVSTRKRQGSLRKDLPRPES